MVGYRTGEENVSWKNDFVNGDELSLPICVLV